MKRSKQKMLEALETRQVQAETQKEVAVATAEPVKANGKVTLLANEQEELASLQEKVDRFDLRVGKIRLAIKELEGRENAVTQERVIAQKTWQSRLQDFAKKHGIDLEDPKTGRWNFDTPTHTFTRTG